MIYIPIFYLIKTKGAVLLFFGKVKYYPKLYLDIILYIHTYMYMYIYIYHILFISYLYLFVYFNVFLLFFTDHCSASQN